MIQLTRFNGTKFHLNAEMIMTVEGTPDTVITLQNNIKILVREAPQAVVMKMIEYHRLVRNPDLPLTSGE